MQRFSSKVDWWLAVIVISVPLISVGTVVAGLMTGDTGAAVSAIITLALVLVVYVGVVWPIAYEVHDRELVVRFGFIRSRVPIDQITRVTPSRNPLASPALSLDRIRVDRRGGGFVLVSPADREGFARAILQRAPSVEIDERLRSA
jgi:membrane protein YdbS with pleckstrin-like domain